MHKDDKAGRIRFHQDGFSVLSYTEINPELTPPRASRSPDAFRAWFSERAIPRTRIDLKEFLVRNNLISSEEYLVKNLALSLVDCYWVKPVDSAISWKDVNLHNNDFGSVSSQGGKSSFSPDASTGGDLPKQWVIKDGKRFLIKSNAGGNYQQSFNEVFASMIHERQMFSESVRYRFVKIKDKGIGCAAEIFTSSKLEFISAWDLLNSKDYPKRGNSRQGFIGYLETKGLDVSYLNSFLDYMVLSDFLIANDDRHYNNFGVLRDADTLEIVSMAPLFDFGNSMGFGHELKNSALLFAPIKGFNSSNRTALGNIRDYSVIDISLLPDAAQVSAFYEGSELSESRIIGLGELFEERKAFAEGLQRGKSFYELSSAFRSNPAYNEADITF